MSGVNDKVIKFYKQDHVSKQSPCMKDYVIVKENGEKQKVPKRRYVLQVAYEMFCSEQGETVVEFHSLWPIKVIFRKEYSIKYASL